MISSSIIARLLKQSDRQELLWEITGTSEPGPLAFFFAFLPEEHYQAKSNLIIVPKDTDILAFKQNLAFFKPEMELVVLEEQDNNVYAGLYPNYYTAASRLSACYKALKPNSKQLFIASVPALLQLLPPKKLFEKLCFQLKVGDEIEDEFFSMLKDIGYINSTSVEDLGQFTQRGGIIDIFSPNYEQPIRIELFGNQVESLRFYHVENQLSYANLNSADIIPVREALYSQCDLFDLIEKYKLSHPEGDKETKEQFLQQLSRKQNFDELDYFSAYFYSQLDSFIDYFPKNLVVWKQDPIEVHRYTEQNLQSLKDMHLSNSGSAINPDPKILFDFSLNQRVFKQELHFTKIHITGEYNYTGQNNFSCFGTGDFQNLYINKTQDPLLKLDAAGLLKSWQSTLHSIYVSASSMTKAERLKQWFDSIGVSVLFYEKDFSKFLKEHPGTKDFVAIFVAQNFDSFRCSQDQLVFLSEENFWGVRQRAKKKNDRQAALSQAKSFHFEDLNVGDRVVHISHGVGTYAGLKEMQVQGISAEFIQIHYKDKDVLYLPIYRINQLQKYSGAGPIDKLGGQSWEKAKVKVRSNIKDIASELLRLYAVRAQTKRPSYGPIDDDYLKFEAEFPYTETDDQRSAIDAILADLQKDQPMDRLVCGDVGFGKTEIAMRAAFKAVQAKRQICVLAPTTVLSFQHFESFKKRFKNWPVEIRQLNRFTDRAEAKETKQMLKEGKVDILIGTHKVLSKDLEFYNLGLLIIDEEQKFGVTHKEKLRKFKTETDTLALSATPIPRTLNMSLVGIRDLSIIYTPPQNRLPVRTYLMKYNNDSIYKAIKAEVDRGGQVYFLHNRVQSIYGIADELLSIYPDLNMRVAHGQMAEDSLEDTMTGFFRGEFQVLLSTAIIESGIDNPRANTIIINNAQQFGLSQLYQLRGRVGRSTKRAYCYLIIPPNLSLDKVAQERLRVIQQNTELGSGFKVASHDLELRGAGNILGEDQTGDVNVVGYDLYVELLEQAIADLKGEKPAEPEIEPDINLPFPALIPDEYIPDIRTRLAYYKALSEIQASEDLDKIEDELRDQFGKPPEQVLNLMGLMMIRKVCKVLGVRDISAGKNSISLSFTKLTKADPAKVVSLSMRESSKYRITPDNRLIFKIDKLEWPSILQELHLICQHLLVDVRI